jgi:hypothetical protein
MAFTDHSDVFLSVLDQGINRVFGHVTRQRPSLFNYGTQAVASHPNLLCVPINAHPVVLARGNPLVTVEPPIPVLGTNGAYGLNFCAQLTKVALDFHPGNLIGLPPELGPPLGAQRFSLQARACGGLGCPSEDTLASLPPVPPQKGREDPRPPRDTTVIPTRQLDCFCVDLFLVGGLDFIGPASGQHVQGKVFGLELVDIKPDGLENSIECYLRVLAQLVLLPQLSVPVIQLTKDVMGLASITLSPTLPAPALPNNPAIEDDRLKIFLDATIGPAPPPGPPGPPGPPPVVGSDRPRTRVGPFDAVAALASAAVRALLEAVRNAFTFSKSDSVNFGPFTLSYDVKAHLEDGTVELRDDNSIAISEVDIKWDKLEVCLGIDIPEICVGGFCIIPTPWGCALRAPKICVFSASPDFEVCLDLGGVITSEISMIVRPVPKYAIDPGRTPAMNDWDAQDAGIPNKWQIVLDVLALDFDLIDIADTVGDLLEAALDAALDTLLGPLPGWAKDLIKAILGPIIDVVRDILDLGDDFGEWLMDKLGVSIGLFNLILAAIANHMAKENPLIELEDPFQILEASGGRIPVKIPVEFLGVRVNKAELILEADVGA